MINLPKQEMRISCEARFELSGVASTAVAIRVGMAVIVAPAELDGGPVDPLQSAISSRRKRLYARGEDPGR
jgi:hypothetical protein